MKYLKLWQSNHGIVVSNITRYYTACDNDNDITQNSCVRMNYLPIDFKLPTLAQGWSSDGTSAREVTMSDVGKTQEYHMRGK